MMPSTTTPPRISGSILPLSLPVLPLLAVAAGGGVGSTPGRGVLVGAVDRLGVSVAPVAGVVAAVASPPVGVVPAAGVSVTSAPGPRYSPAARRTALYTGCTLKSGST